MGINLNDFYNSLDSTPKDISYVDLKETPLYKLERFINVIINGGDFKKRIAHLFSRINIKLDQGEIEEAGKNMVFTRGWGYISQFDEKWVVDLKKVDKDKLLAALDATIRFFENREAYERCAFLIKIKNHLLEE